ncbi:hypothetical protein F2P79_025757 [Pimephales promelas]|nr:hypothetical protein F2P79_025757 [Pimephales promelas]
MPRHLISGWMNEIPTVPTCYLAKPQPREQVWQNQRGKKTLLSLAPEARPYQSVKSIALRTDKRSVPVAQYKPHTEGEIKDTPDGHRCGYLQLWKDAHLQEICCLSPHTAAPPKL